MGVAPSRGHSSAPPISIRLHDAVRCEGILYCAAELELCPHLTSHRLHAGSSPAVALGLITQVHTASRGTYAYRRGARRARGKNVVAVATSADPVARDFHRHAPDQLCIGA